jgi:hypothetical protein
MGSPTYGKNTGAGFSTFEELQYISDENIPFFLVKMCDHFDVDFTRFLLPKSVSYFEWLAGYPVPDDLVTRILRKLESPAGPAISSEVLSSLPGSTMIPLESLAENEAIELLIHLGCSAELNLKKWKVKEQNLIIDGGYLMHLHEVHVLQELEKNMSILRIPYVKGILAKLKKLQVNVIPVDLINTVRQRVEEEENRKREEEEFNALVARARAHLVEKTHWRMKSAVALRLDVRQIIDDAIATGDFVR